MAAQKAVLNGNIFSHPHEAAYAIKDLAQSLRENGDKVWCPARKNAHTAVYIEGANCILDYDDIDYLDNPEDPEPNNVVSFDEKKNGEPGV